MTRRGFVLLQQALMVALLLTMLLAVSLSGCALGADAELGQAKSNMIVIPASQDVYISMGENRVSVFNQTETLLCAVDVAEGNKSERASYPGAPAIQFDISGLNITDDDVAVLVLKAASMQNQGDPVLVALLTIGSDWDESSDYTTFLVNILPAWNIIKKNDATAMSSNTDGDGIFAFDVSQKLKNAIKENNGNKKDSKISFLLEAISNSSAQISFLPKESGQGPYLMIMPYPGIQAAAAAEPAVQPDLAINSSLTTDGPIAPSENGSEAKMQMQTDRAKDMQPIPAVGSTLMAGRSLSNKSLD
ncbi:MAG TPA: hypothetical protein PKK68_10500 [Methanothrix soehngenii]|nr:hypothetical protein [Methanothrix soehngenii]